MTIALKYKLSDAINMFITADVATGDPIVEIEFKFVRYQLIINDLQKADQLKSLIHEITLQKPKPKGEEVRMPNFYNRR